MHAAIATASANTGTAAPQIAASAPPTGGEDVFGHVLRAAEDTADGAAAVQTPVVPAPNGAQPDKTGLRLVPLPAAGPNAALPATSPATQPPPAKPVQARKDNRTAPPDPLVSTPPGVAAVVLPVETVPPSVANAVGQTGTDRS